MTASLPRAVALLSLLLLLAASVAVRAAEVAGLFEAVVPVSSQGAAERVRATAEGFRQVLVKTSGQRSVLANAAVQAEFGKAESLLGSFRYEAGRAELPGAAAAPRVRLKFDADSVRGILNRAGAPVWSSNRPLVYLWVLRDGAARSLFSLGTPQADTLLDMAAQRGLPVALPPPGEIVPAGPLNETPAAVKEAAERSDAKVVLFASVSAAAKGARAKGSLLVEGVPQRLEAAGGDEAEALRELMALAADALGARYGAVARQDRLSTVQLRVDGVAGLAEFVALERWLASQPLLKDAAVARLEASVASYSLTVAGDVEGLLQAMRADGRFAQVAAPVVDGGVTTVRATLATAPGG